MDPFPIAKNNSGCLLSIPMIHNVKLVTRHYRPRSFDLRSSLLHIRSNPLM
ncbi:hypothetical protein GPS47_07420 [Acinetobacter haemolyticus]|uniref:Uncharacterized protein n=1 Tax=Acinetobacter haemolyticus TaxID=29430 RepID=A0AAJ3DAK2_ACIHA|nr:hypothetical protein [Acinetobacter haemolyticus]NAR29584.1 hypothetical protein [Acinetobacter haemolyticus]NAR35006.1 hypothetical protein [Acinetobacter haemolyticus]NAR46210.1 hypothetical protein [Acinetobacter haemolyticus]NAR50160.1 hypothetical protein [Acinetobacter haemolyticus]